MGYSELWRSTLDNPTESHPYNCVATIPPDTQIIIMGTCPPPENEADTFRWYYGSRHNYLWTEIMVRAVGFTKSSPFALDDAKQFLKDKKAWMFDICKRYNRAIPGSALDANLRVIEKEKLSDLFSACRSLTEVILTGTKTETLFREALEDERLIEKYRFNKDMKGRSLPRTRPISLLGGDGLCLPGRSMKITTVASPSRRNGRADYALDHFRKALPSWFASGA
jgi:G:T/U-mismatch repair DNA glycosylase